MREAGKRRGDWPLYTLAAVTAVLGLLWLGAAGAALLCGQAVPRGRVAAVLAAFAAPGDPSSAWREPVGPAAVYWTVTALVLAAAVGLVIVARRLLAGVSTGSAAGEGFAGRGEIAQTAGRRHLSGMARTLRPGLPAADCRELGYRLGRAHGVDCWVSVEDSLIVLGPPRSGKGLHAVIPAILDAPGAVITTSTRPDNLAVTMQARRERGPVAIFDPQRLTGAQAAARWSPIRGCVRPRVALARARALCTDPGRGTDNASFWSQQCLAAVRCLLHAAALDERTPGELYRWSLSAMAAVEAVDILATHPDAAPGWGGALEAIVSADARQRDSTWSMVANVFAPLSDPQVLAAASPGVGEWFDPVRFLTERGTLYLLGTAGGATATANLVTALVEDVVETARTLAANEPGGRLDPPLAVLLDEAANYPLPSLPELMSDGGGSGITTLVVLQSLAQARARWGHDAAGAIWDAAIVKLILGGAGNAADLRDLSALIGTREQQRRSESWGPDGRRTVSTSSQEAPILEPGRLRTLPFGQAVLLLRSAAPILLQLTPWTRRPDAAALHLARGDTENALRRTPTTLE